MLKLVKKMCKKRILYIGKSSGFSGVVVQWNINVSYTAIFAEHSSKVVRPGKRKREKKLPKTKKFGVFFKQIVTLFQDEGSLRKVSC